MSKSLFSTINDHHFIVAVVLNPNLIGLLSLINHRHKNVYKINILILMPIGRAPAPARVRPPNPNYIPSRRSPFEGHAMPRSVFSWSLQALDLGGSSSRSRSPLATAAVGPSHVATSQLLCSLLLKTQLGQASSEVIFQKKNPNVNHKKRTRTMFFYFK